VWEPSIPATEESEDEDDSVDLEENLIQKNNLLEIQQKMLKEKDEELRQKQKDDAEKSRRMFDELESLRKQGEDLRVKYESQVEIIHKYIESFETMYERKPMRDEIYDNLKNDVDLDSLDKFLESYGTADFV
jgi:hypothetical protein